MRAVRTVRRTAAPPLGLSRADLVLGASLCGMLLWTMLVGWHGDRALSATLSYAVAPLGLLAGAAASRWAVSRGAGVIAAGSAAALLLAAVVAVPFYSNAEAAAGVQLIALAGLVLMGTTGSAPGTRAGTGTVLLAAVIGALGLLLAARSQAASLLAVLIVVIAVLALRGRLDSSRRTVRGIGLGSVAGAVLVILFLAAAPFWPWWLEENESLSWARQSLWRDALALWRENPIVGGGPGSFHEFSEISRSEEHLYAVHSSILQVAAELGGVGVLLFLAVLISGTFVAAQGGRAQRAIGVAAWCALAVHSMIDHLYEFPLVCLLAGVVIGWTGIPARRDLSTAPPRLRTGT